MARRYHVSFLRPIERGTRVKPGAPPGAATRQDTTCLACLTIMDGNQAFRTTVTQQHMDRVKAHLDAVEALVGAIVKEYPAGAKVINDRPTSLIGRMLVASFARNAVAPKEAVVALVMADLRSLVSHTRHPTVLFLHLEPLDNGLTVLEIGKEEGAEVTEDFMLTPAELAYQDQLEELFRTTVSLRKLKRKREDEDEGVTEAERADDGDLTDLQRMIKKEVDAMISAVMAPRNGPAAKKHKPADE